MESKTKRHIETVEKCERCGGKMYKVGTEDDWTSHCWKCNNVDTQVTIDF